MDQRTLECLEYPEVLRRLQSLCTSLLGRHRAEALRPSTDPERVRVMLEETSQMKALLEEKGGLPSRGFPDIRGILERAKRGAVLEPEELLLVAESIRASLALKGMAKGLEDRFWRVRALLQRLRAPEGLLREIERAIDPKGEIKDDASPKLLEIRSRIAQAKKRVLDALRHWVQRALGEGLVQSDIVTERAGRYVVLLKASSKGRTKGIVHGASGSGASLYFEPLEVVELNNDLGVLREEEAEEVQRILRYLSFQVAQEEQGLKDDLEVQGEVDLLYAKARLAIELRGEVPQITPRGEVKLLGCRHPLLLLRGKEVVPVDILLTLQCRILVVSGANAGGKTVALKTLGLLALMVQSGMPIPASGESSLPVFRQVFAHIGDEQNLSEDLSTFSSFVTWTREVLPRVDPETLVLIDEFGSGTDQVQGAALAMAILDEIRDRGGYALVTTHLDALKAYGFTTPGVRNASVEFDPGTMNPTYRLLYDIAGKSWTFSIARRWGLPEGVLSRAEKYGAELKGEEARVLEELSGLKEQVQRELDRQRQLRQELEGQRERLRELWEGLKAKRREILGRMEKRARERLKEFEEKLEELKRQLKASSLPQVRAELRRLQGEVSSFKPSLRQVGPSLKGVKEGDWVTVKTLGAQGKVLSVSGERVEVAVGSIRVQATLSELGPAEVKEAPSASQVVVDATGYGVPEVNVRGMRVEEALQRVEKLVDEALIKGWDQIHIIHGIGTGALKRAIREYLKGFPFVRAIRSAPRDRGGEGVTVVDLG